MLTRDQLHPPTTLALTFANIRNLLAGRASGVVLDQRIASQLIDLLFCKFHDENTTEPNKPLRFQRKKNEEPTHVYKRILDLFQEVTENSDFGQLFSDGEKLTLQPDLLTELVEILQPFEITKAQRDVIGEAFEAFIGPGLRGQEGQFFTPRNVVQLTCKILGPKKGEVILDPACGSGGYLTEALKQVNGGTLTTIGIDKDSFLARIAAIQLGMHRKNGDSKSWAYCANSLDLPEHWPPKIKGALTNGVDVIMTNPPFGAKISVGGSVVEQFELGRNWKFDSKKKAWGNINGYADNRPPQILFIERCLQFLREGGRMGIVLPDGVIGNTSLGYVRHYIQQIADVIAIVDLPLETFLPSTSTKTSILFLRKKRKGTQQKHIFMAIAENCGHDRRGKPKLTKEGKELDDLPSIANEFRLWRETHATDF